MFKKLFPRMPITKLNKNINKKVRLHVYNNSRIPQLVLCKVTIEHRNVELPCSFSVVSRNGLGFLGLLACEKLKLHNNRYHPEKGQINEPRQDMSHIAQI